MFGILCIFACSINFSCFFQWSLCETQCQVWPDGARYEGLSWAHARYISIWCFVRCIFCGFCGQSLKFARNVQTCWTMLHICFAPYDVSTCWETWETLRISGKLHFFWFLPFLPFCLERSVGEWQSSWLWSFRTHRWRHLRRKLVKRQSSRQRLGRDKLTQSKNKVMERHNVVTCQRMKLGKTTR